MSAGASKRGPRKAADRVRLLLEMLPWLMEREKVRIADVSAQFDISEADLIEDIEMAAMCGIPPYTPYELTELIIDEGWIHVGLNRHFERRLELRPAEAFGLSLLAVAAREIPGFTAGNDLESAVRKLTTVLGSGLVDVDVESPEFLDVVSDAAESGEVLRIVYWTPATNEEKERNIVVRAVFADKGHWYVTADDDVSGEQRHFRVDRIRSAVGTGRRVAVQPTAPVIPEWFADTSGRLVATVRLGQGAAWVAETYPCTVKSEDSNGMTIEIVANSEHWLGRLLLRAGDEMQVVGPPELVDLRRRTASQVLARYRSNSVGS